MAMEKIFQPELHEFVSPVVNFEVFRKEAIKARDALRESVRLAPLKQVSYPESIPSPPPHVREARLEDVIVKKETSVLDVIANEGVELRIPAEHLKAAAERLSVMDALAVMNNRDIFFRKKNEQPDIPEKTQLETLKYVRKALLLFCTLIRQKILEGYNAIKKKPTDVCSDPDERERNKHLRAKMFSRLRREGGILKYGDYFQNEITGSRSDVPVSTTVNDFVVTINILRPYNHALDGQERRNLRLAPHWKYVLRGENSLLDVHALFKCSSDYGTSSELGDVMPKVEDFNFMRYPSSFLFIHDTFYVSDYYSGMEEVVQQISDTPLIQLTDISEPIRKWMLRKKDQFGPTQVKSILNVSVKELTCRLGYPYVYIHQGCCEHVFFFSDLRLMDKHDYPESYPHRVSDESLKNYCVVCHKNLAEYIVESEKLPMFPAHMCSDCYSEFFYDGDYKPDTEAKAYFYADPATLSL
uniref:snRNA-activating protein complex subunit 3 n=1 Tax=Syphacia muris TaxID=451379 RepID=A0A158R5Y0_9BILA